MEEGEEDRKISVIGSTTISEPILNANHDENSDTEEDEEVAKLPPRLRLVKATDISPAFKDKNSTAIEHIGTSGKKVTVVDDLSHLIYIKYLSFRSNLVRDISGLRSLESLVVLELYENRVKSFKGLEKLVNLTTLDLSYNRIRYLDGKVLKNLTKLKKLYVAQNKIAKIEGLESCIELEMVDLGMNRIEKIEGVSKLLNLKELWLGKNKITKVENLDGLKNLKRLDIQSNRLQKLTLEKNNLDVVEDEGDAKKLSIEEREAIRKEKLEELRKKRKEEEANHSHSHGSCTHSHEPAPVPKAEPEVPNAEDLTGEVEAMKVTQPVQEQEVITEELFTEFDSVETVEELYLSHQGICSVVGLEKLTSLVILDLSANKIKDLSAFRTYAFELLEDLWLGENMVEDFEQVKNLGHLKALDTIYFEHNPIAKDPEYKKKLLDIIPSLKQIDASRL